MEDASLWGVADSAPYFHDGGSAPSMSRFAATRATPSGVTRAFESLSGSDRDAVVRFLKGLKAPADAKPAGPGVQGTIAMVR